jgi:hypothetical protein
MGGGAHCAIMPFQTIAKFLEARPFVFKGRINYERNFITVPAENWNRLASVFVVVSIVDGDDGALPSSLHHNVHECLENS